MDPILVGRSTTTAAGAPVVLQPRYGNRHGLVAGATGTGKTVTLMTLAEGFSRIGVPVFIADVKGDVAGLAMPGEDTAKLRERVAGIGLQLLDALCLRPLLGASVLDRVPIEVVLAIAVVSRGREFRLRACDVGGTASGSQEPAQSDARGEGHEQKNDRQGIHGSMMPRASDIRS